MKQKLFFLTIALFSAKSLFAQEAEYAWAKFMNAGIQNLAGITVDSNGNTYTLGHFSGYFDFNQVLDNNHDLTAECFYNGFDFECYTNIYIQKLDSSGNLVFLNQYGGGNTHVYAKDIKLDATGALLISGSFSGVVDFDLGVGTTNLDATNGNLFILKLNPDGTLIWAKQFFGVSIENIFLATDASGNVFTASAFYNSITVNNSILLTSNGSSDIFIQKFDFNGNFLWVKQIGGTGVDFPITLNIDSNNNLYTTGHFDVTVDFDPGEGVHQIVAINRKFIQKLDTNGNFQWAMQFPFHDISAVAFDQNDNIILTGYFMGTVDFDTNESIATLTSTGNNDIYIEKLNPDGIFVWVRQISGTTDNDRSVTITSDADGNVYTAGRFWDTVDFNPNSSYQLTSLGGYDVFIHKLDSNGNFGWAKQIGGTGPQDAKKIVVDISSNIYTTGTFYDNTDFDPGIDTVTIFGFSTDNVFIQKMTPVDLGSNEMSSPEIKMYPNPTKGYFILDLNDQIASELVVYDIQGKQVFKQTNVMSGKLNLDLQTGIYCIKLNIQGKQFVRKLVVN